MNGAPLNIDLHTHSNCSDGSLSPAALIARAAQAGVEVLALTDHDTVAGLEEAERAAREHRLHLVPGVEISVCWLTLDIHVLGLWIDPCESALHSMLEHQGDLRRARMAKICARLAKLRLPGAKLLAAVQAHAALPTRAHLAQALIAGGHVPNADAAFRNYLGRGKPAHVAPEWPALDQVVSCIRAAGGVAALAHPLRYAISAGARRRLISDFVAAGGGALEVVTGGSIQHVDSCAALARNHGLMGSVGSDFHNPQAAWNPLGRSLKLPDCIAPVWRSFGL